MTCSRAFSSALFNSDNTYKVAKKFMFLWPLFIENTQMYLMCTWYLNTESTAICLNKYFINLGLECAVTLKRLKRVFLLKELSFWRIGDVSQIFYTPQEEALLIHTPSHWPWAIMTTLLLSLVSCKEIVW